MSFVEVNGLSSCLSKAKQDYTELVLCCNSRQTDQLDGNCLKGQWSLRENAYRDSADRSRNCARAAKSKRTILEI